MIILITGVGVTGKSSYRRHLAKNLEKTGAIVFQYDADQFTDRPEDKNCLAKLPHVFNGDAFYVIEDIHATLSEAALPLEKYDLIYYLKPKLTQHWCFWLERLISWWHIGHYSWEANSGWKGTGQPNDYRNLLPITKACLRDLWHRHGWIKKDLAMLKKHNCLIIKPLRTTSGLTFSQQKLNRP